ncbi:MAG TPA: methyltransferase domain-containing protein, partial [Ktedonobacteraceae bacterium]|nr:methyltransferase domain-containing protein [Ktedonobacteraceae bacterium]
DVAFECPDCEVAGVDSSQSMIQYAIARARSQNLTNVSFGVMDITQPLDFSDASFALVNARFLVGVLRREAWMPFLKECTRILKPGGTLRLTEPIDMGETTSPAGNRLSRLMSEALCRAGYGFSVDGHGMGMSMTLPSLLREMNYQHVRTLPHLLDYSEDQSSAWGDMKRQLEAGSRLTPPFFERVGLLSQEETQRLFQQAYQEHHQKGLRGAWHFVTVLGEKPS